METSTQIQKLRNKEDLELLLAGDKVNVAFKNFNGVATFLDSGEFGLRLLVGNKEIIHLYYREKCDIDIKDNKIIEITNRRWSEGQELTETDRHYDYYNKLIGESD